MSGSALYVGHVAHRRLRPRVHALRYRLYSLLLDLDEIDALSARLRLFSRGRFNLFSFRDRDHGDGSAVPLKTQIENHLVAAGLPAGGPIRLLTMPRVLGFAFNPLSVYFCHAADGRLSAILYEVNNTFGQRHSYLLPAIDDGHGTVRHGCAKAFHVSPFMGMDMAYGFRVRPPADRLGIAITGSDAAGPIITAVLSSHRVSLGDGTLVRVFVTHPLLTVKVVVGILWEALQLWRKGIAIRHRPAPPAHPVTVAPRLEAACT